jgi:hypothetical protein
MSRRKLLLGAVSPALLTLVAVLTWLLMPRQGDDINQQNYERIREGMTAQEVEGILGGPAGNYTAGRRRPVYETGRPITGPLRLPPKQRRQVESWGDYHLEWVGEEVAIEVCFDLDWRAKTKTVVRVEDTHAEAGFFVKLRRLLPW